MGSSSSLYIQNLALVPDNARINLLSQNILLTDQLVLDASVIAVFFRPGDNLSLPDLDYFPNLKFILSDTTGISHLSHLRASKKNLNFLTLRDATVNQRDSLDAAFQHALTLSLLLFRPILPILASNSMVFDKPRSSYIGDTWDSLKIGILGFGRIGQKLFNAYISIGITSIVFDTDSTQLDSYSPSHQLNFASSMDDLFIQSDIVIICVTDRPSNTNLISNRLLSLSSLRGLINISRDHIVDKSAVYSSLLNGQLSHYISDFPLDFSQDQLDDVLKLRNSGRLISLPHMGGATKQSWDRSIKILIDVFLSRL